MPHFLLFMGPHYQLAGHILADSLDFPGKAWTNGSMDWASLEQLKGADLRNLYAEVMGHPPPPKASVHFLKGNIAWHLQAQDLGEEPRALRQSLLHQCKVTARRKKQPFKPGTRLVREWQGNVYEVTVLDQGFEFEGVNYRSLSEVANLITGSHCSGPRFFGLDKQP